MEGGHNPRLWGKQPVSAKGRSEAGLSLPFANLWTQISKSSPPLRLSPPSWRDEYLLLLFRIHPQRRLVPALPLIYVLSHLFMSVWIRAYLPCDWNVIWNHGAALDFFQLWPPAALSTWFLRLFLMSPSFWFLNASFLTGTRR